jgi:hypothetical protein
VRINGYAVGADVHLEGVSTMVGTIVIAAILDVKSAGRRNNEDITCTELCSRTLYDC